MRINSFQAQYLAFLMGVWKEYLQLSIAELQKFDDLQESLSEGGSQFIQGNELLGRVLRLSAAHQDLGEITRLYESLI